jgi:hypothetical protein
MFRTTRHLLVAFIALMLVAPSAFAHGHTIYGPMPAPNGVGMGAYYTASEWNGCKPGQYGTTDWWETCAPADATPDLKRRSEIKPGASQSVGWLKADLGPAANDGRSWHSLVQLHGPDSDGAWRYSQVALRVERGYWRLWGDDGLSNASAWSIPLMPYVDDYATHAMITYRTDALRSRVCISLDPAGAATGLQTWCHDAEPWDSQWLIWHSGLYRGSGNTPHSEGGIQPTYRQGVLMKDVHAIRYPA